MWNQGESAKTGEARTTCELEQFHKTINHQIGKFPRKTLWYCMSLLKAEIGRLIGDYSFEIHSIDLARLGTVSYNKVLKLNSPGQNKRSEANQRERRIKQLQKTLDEFNP